MLQKDVAMFMEHCELKGLSVKTICSYEQTLRLFIQYLEAEDVTELQEISAFLTK